MIRYPNGSDVQIFDRVIDDEGLSGLIIGTPENLDFLRSLGADVTHPQQGAALVIRDNGELKWRPLPGQVLTFKEASRDRDRDMTVVKGMWGGRIPIVPPPFDFYCSMDLIEVGDIVHHAGSQRATVVAVFSRHEFAPDIHPSDWGSTAHGFLVESIETKGLYLYLDANEDISLIQRSS